MFIPRFGSRSVTGAGQVAPLSTAAAGEPAPYADQLALARACLAGDPVARAHFVAEYSACLRLGITRICTEPGFVEETAQQLQLRLLSGPDAKLAAYSGIGSLGAWLQVVAARAALDALRASARRQHYERAVAEAAILPVSGGESTFERERYGEHFRSALRTALDALDTRERHLVKLRFAAGLELEAIGDVHGVHRTTVARWLGSLYSRLQRSLQSELAQRGAPVSTSEMHGLAHVLHSDLHGALDSWLQRSHGGRTAQPEGARG
jgi:RNA polymerase sigma-70 factor, ECF subfamily